jgi:hypothetical protein
MEQVESGPGPPAATIKPRGVKFAESNNEFEPATKGTTAAKPRAGSSVAAMFGGKGGFVSS